LGYDTLAVNIAGLINSPGTRSALRELSSDSITISLKRQKYFNDKWNKIKLQKADTTRDVYLLDEEGRVIMNENGQPLIAN
jgi:hypothetical protein